MAHLNCLDSVLKANCWNFRCRECFKTVICFSWMSYILSWLLYLYLLLMWFPLTKYYESASFFVFLSWLDSLGVFYSAQEILFFEFLLLIYIFNETISTAHSFGIFRCICMPYWCPFSNLSSFGQWQYVLLLVVFLLSPVRFGLQFWVSDMLHNKCIF